MREMGGKMKRVVGLACCVMLEDGHDVGLLRCFCHPPPARLIFRGDVARLRNNIDADNPDYVSDTSGPLTISKWEVDIEIWRQRQRQHPTPPIYPLRVVD